MRDHSRHKSWTFLFPVENLHLPCEVRGRFRVQHVTFVHRDKLPRVRKGLGLRAPISEIKSEGGPGAGGGASARAGGAGREVGGSGDP
jgi:hypothetical protein